jgi:hypothetical protein
MDSVKTKCYVAPMANVIPLPTARGASTRAELFLRIGETHYGQIASLYSEGYVPIRRAIFDASKLKYQLDFLKTLRDDGVELILDPKAAGARSRRTSCSPGAPLRARPRRQKAITP